MKFLWLPVVLIIESTFAGIPIEERRIDQADGIAKNLGAAPSQRDAMTPFRTELMVKGVGHGLGDGLDDPPVDSGVGKSLVKPPVADQRSIADLSADVHVPDLPNLDLLSDAVPEQDSLLNERSVSSGIDASERREGLGDNLMKKSPTEERSGINLPVDLKSAVGPNEHLTKRSDQIRQDDIPDLTKSNDISRCIDGMSRSSDLTKNDNVQAKGIDLDLSKSDELLGLNSELTKSSNDVLKTVDVILTRKTRSAKDREVNPDRGNLARQLLTLGSLPNISIGNRKK